MLRSALPLLVAAVTLTSCSGASSPATPASTPEPESNFTVATSLQPGANLLGLYDVEVDAATGDIAIVPTRTGALTQDRYQLPIDGFLRPGDLKIKTVSRAGIALDLTMELSHPFAAPTNVAGTPTAANRADLGIVPRIVAIADLPTGASVPAYSYFGGTVIARNDVLYNRFAYCDLGNLLPDEPNLDTTIHPFVMAVSESTQPLGEEGSRVGVPNGGQVTGNYNPAQGGWQRGNIGPNADNWTGFDVLHQGQSTVFELSLHQGALLDHGQVPFRIAVIAEYIDPRGGITSATKRANRLPGATVDVAKFVYRMPHGAADVSALQGDSGAVEAENTGSVDTITGSVVDWDARATATTFPVLSDDPAPNTVVAGAEGPPTIRVDCPGVTLTPATLMVVDDDGPLGGDPEPDSGVPGDEIYYEGIITNSAAAPGQVAGIYPSLYEATDPEFTMDRSGYEFPVDGNLAPVAAGLAKRVWEFGEMEVVATAGCVPQSLLFDFNSNAQGWTPYGTNSDQYDWSHFRQGCANAVSEANAAGVLSSGGGYLSMGDDNDNLACELVTDYGPNAISGIRSPLLTIPEGCAADSIELEFDAYVMAAAGATVRAFYSTSSETPGAAIWTQTATGEEQIFANQIIAIPDAVADGPGRIWFTFTGGATTYETPTGELAGLAIDNVELRMDAATPILSTYTPPIGTCTASTVTFDFTDAGGWQGGQFFGLPNGDAQATIRPMLGGVGSFRWTACDAASDPTGTYASVIANSAGGIVGTSINISADQDLTDGGLGTGCNFLDDYGGPASYNIVSPRVLIPTQCGLGDEVTLRWNAYLNSNATSGLDATSIRLYVSSDDGASWGTPLWTQNASNGGTASINQLIYLDTWSGLPGGIRFRFEFTSSAGSVRQSASLAQPFGCYIDLVRVGTNNATTPVILP